MNIGILDDSVAILDYLESTLSMDGHLIFRHTSGTSLLDAIFAPSSSSESRARYDLLILDLLVPGNLSGVDVFLKVRKAFDTTDLPIIVITAVDGSTLKQFRQILPDDIPIIRKPFSPHLLRRLVSQLLYGR